MEKLLIHTVWNQTADFSTKFRRRPRAEPSPNTGVDNCCYCQNHARTGGAPTTITIIESRTEAMKMRGLRVHLFLLLCDKNPTANSPRKQRGEREKETNQMAVVSGSSWCPGLLPRDSDLTQVPRRESSEAGGLEDSGSSFNSRRPSLFHNWNYWNDLALGDLCRSGCPGLLVNSVGREREGDPELGTGGAKRKKRVFLVPTACTWEIAYNSRAFALIIRVQKSGRLSPIQIINHNFSYSMLEFSKVFILMYSKKKWGNFTNVDFHPTTLMMPTMNLPNPWHRMNLRTTMTMPAALDRDIPNRALELPHSLQTHDLQGLLSMSHDRHRLFYHFLRYNLCLVEKNEDLFC